MKIVGKEVMRKKFLLLSVLATVGLCITLPHLTFYLTKKKLEGAARHPSSVMSISYSNYRFMKEEEIKRISRLGKEEKVRQMARIISCKFCNWLDNLEEEVARKKIYICFGVRDHNMWNRGMPKLGELYLQMCDLDRGGGYLRKSRVIAHFLLRKQTEAGGWGVNVVVAPDDALYNRLWYLGDNYLESENRSLDGVYDSYRKACLREGPTQNSLIFLIRLNNKLNDPKIDIRIKRGLKFILDSQRPNGAWPDWVGYDREEGNYHKYDSFNDLTINLCVEALIEGYERYRDIKYLKAVEKAGEFIKKSQILRVVKDQNGKFLQAGWALHYWKGKPVQGRPFEPASICIPVTAANVLTLLNISRITNDDSYLEVARRAVDFLRKAELAGKYKGMWPCFVEIGTSRGIYPLKVRGGYELTYNIENGLKDTGYGFLIRGDMALEIQRKIYVWEKELGISLTYPNYEKEREEEILRRLNKVIKEIEKGATWGSGRKRTLLPGKHTYYMEAFRDYLALKQSRLDKSRP